MAYYHGSFRLVQVWYPAFHPPLLAPLMVGKDFRPHLQLEVLVLLMLAVLTQVQVTVKYDSSLYGSLDNSDFVVRHAWCSQSTADY